MRRAKNPSIWGLILCNILGIHNHRRQSTVGKVHYCSRCGIVTRGDRRQGMAIADASRFAPSMKVTFGTGQEYRGVVAQVDLFAGRIVLSRIEVVPKWRSKLAKMVVGIRWCWFRLLLILRVN